MMNEMNEALENMGELLTLVYSVNSNVLATHFCDTNLCLIMDSCGC